VSKKAAQAAEYEEWKALVLNGKTAAAPALAAAPSSGDGAGGSKGSAAAGGKENAEDGGGKAAVGEGGAKRKRGEGPAAAAAAPAGGKLKQSKLSFAPLTTTPPTTAN
jgi:hypothetical protein